jgi:tRNA 5-methylaminomethyl-2-thiouridine biosynthesis bifunctional protein
MSTTDQTLTPAELEWQDDVPRSRAFQDIYFNQAGGIAETEHVFLVGNDLPERWQNLPEDARFTLIETGFGTGLNFLCARDLWLRTAPAGARLHYISFEKHPLTEDDLARALAHWPQWSSATRALLAQWPVPMQGLYTLLFDDGRIRLTLALGDAAEMLARIDARADAWFLDGFAPSRNPQMWSEALFAGIADHSGPGTTFATFTAAGVVRRGLTQVGFAIAKRPGFGRKREMLTGSFQSGYTAAASKPWLLRPGEQPAQRRAIVIGAGLAGATTAAALARNGWQVEVLEQHAGPAQAGSGNAQGALYIKLPTQPTQQSRLHLAGLHYSAALIRTLQAQDSASGDICGLISLALDAKAARHQQQLLDSGLYPDSLVQPLSQAEASARAGTATGAGGLWFPQGGWACPPRVCATLLAAPSIRCHYDTTVETLEYDREQRQWRINGGAFCAPVVVVCCAERAGQLAPLAHLPLKPIRGQTTRASVSPDTPTLNTVVCGEGYVSPPQEGKYCFGATFRLRDDRLDVREHEHEENLDLLERALPQLAASLRRQPREGRAAFRATTPDYLPIVGPAPDADWVLSHFARLSKDANWAFEAQMQHLPGLFVNTGHGSKGLISCPISAELLLSQIENTPLPLPRDVAEALNPVRFLIKGLIKRSI